MKKAKRAKSKEQIKPIKGWVLLSREELALCEFGDWYIAWHEVFSSKKYALQFAQDNSWPQPYRAVRGEIGVRRP